jgi:hypothetical protein
MRRGIGIVLLAAGTVLGFGWGFARLGGYCPAGCHGPGFYGHGRWGDHGQALEDRAADACVRAAERVLNQRKAPPPAAATPGADHPPNP